jgi:hypothetical protein
MPNTGPQELPIHGPDSKVPSDRYIPGGHRKYLLLRRKLSQENIIGVNDKESHKIIFSLISTYSR